LQRKRRSAARGNLHDTAPWPEAVNGNSSRAVVRRRAIAELSRLVVAPRENAAITFQCQRVRVPARERDDTASRADTGDGTGRRVIRRSVSMAQRSRAILSPREDRAAARQRETERIACRDRLDGR